MYQGDREIKVTGISTMGRQSKTGYIEVEESLDLSKSYTVNIEGYGETTVIPMGIFDSQYFADNYHYDGTDLGAVTGNGSTTFKVCFSCGARAYLIRNHEAPLLSFS